MRAKSREGTIHYHVQDETGNGPGGGAADRPPRQVR